MQGDRRFVIPVYQRPYVWEKERQWEPLWADVESTARRLAEARVAAHAKGAPAPEADKSAPPHFLGAIVVEQHLTATGDIDVRSVVDGQQRLTTLQLLLRGVLDAFEAAELKGPDVTKIRRLTQNDERIVSGDDLHKVWPRPADQEAYLQAVSSVTPSEYDSLFAAARRYFADSALEFLCDDDVQDDPYAEGDELHRRAALLVATLLGLVKLVVIDLEDVDDAQVIFEALNARNTPLSATDLVKNLLFMRAQAQHHDPQELYDRVWSRFDRDADWWRESVGIGHAQRARQDWLLGDWLIAETGRVINVGRLYGEFRAWLDSSGTTPVKALESVNRYADAYETLHDRMPGATPAELRAFRRIQRLNISAATPVLLWLQVQGTDRLPAAERELAMLAVESFVVRRMAAKWQTRAYGQVFAEVLKSAQSAAAQPGRAVIEALRSDPHGYGWPSDRDIAEQFNASRYYGPGGISQERLRLLLGAVDARLHQDAHMAEPVTIEYGKLQVEHVIPRSWRQHWPVVAEDENERQVLEQQREAALHRIGNLTLVSSSLNPSMSNDPWEAKRDELRKHSHLRLNALLCEHDSWEEQKIAARAGWLAGQLGREWAGPNADFWNGS